MQDKKKRLATVRAEEAGLPLVEVMTAYFPAKTREECASLVCAGAVFVDQKRVRSPSLKVRGGERILLYETPATSPSSARAIPIVYRDRHLIVADKPAALATQLPREGGAALDVLLAAELKTRVYAVHRLDAAASGLVMLVFSPKTQALLQRALATHAVMRVYLAVCHGHPAAQGRITTPVAGKPAATRFVVRERLSHATLVEVELETGRNHQIRVHFAASGHPLLGDIRHAPAQIAGLVPRLLLHATKLAFKHPIEGHDLEFEVPPPEAFLRSLESLR